MLLRKLIFNQFLFVLMLGTQLLAAQQLTAEDVVRKTDASMRGNTLQGEMVIRTIRPSWSREMSLKTWMKGSDYTMILITSPVRDNGIAFLKRRKEVWNWIPMLDRTIKLPPSMMSQSWMGTDFTNDDLVKESSIVNDYTHSFKNDTTIRGVSCYTIKMIPKPTAAVVWGKLNMYVDKKNFVEMMVEFFDEDGTMVNIMNSLEVTLMGGRMVPTRVEMIPLDKKEQRTEIIYLSLIFDQPIDDSFFSLQQLKKLR